ncbi:hypothetical protein LCGC14_2555330 [marine sediment metagenome]|uniref:Uncharacterized protein n=1 Tax=marine sediment metagenome TaxID=412755 RepID=A0A0F9B9K3_9ZZZZ
MPIPIAVAGAAKVALPLLAKLPAYAKALYGSKHFLTALLGAGYLGSTVVGAIGQAGERGLTREQMRLQGVMGKASAEATKRTVTESRARTKEYIAALLKSKKEERKEVREFAALQSFTESQNRQMALVIQAIQTMGRRPMGTATQAPGAGMVGLMRGGF